MSGPLSAFHSFMTPSSITADAALFDSRLSMIVELNPPTPLGPVWRVPPVEQNPDFSTGQDDWAADVFRLGPEVQTLDPASAHGQARHRPLGGPHQLTALREQEPFVVT